MTDQQLNNRDIKDPVEKAVADALDAAGIQYVHESQARYANGGLDFYLPDYDCYIECKAYHTERTGKQIAGKQVIMVQGYKAAAAFADMLRKKV